MAAAAGGRRVDESAAAGWPRARPPFPTLAARPVAPASPALASTALAAAALASAALASAAGEATVPAPNARSFAATEGDDAGLPAATAAAAADLLPSPRAPEAEAPRGDMTDGADADSERSAPTKALPPLSLVTGEKVQAPLSRASAYRQSADEANGKRGVRKRPRLRTSHCAETSVTAARVAGGGCGKRPSQAHLGGELLLVVRVAAFREVEGLGLRRAAVGSREATGPVRRTPASHAGLGRRLLLLAPPRILPHLQPRLGELGRWEVGVGATRRLHAGT